MRFLKITIFSFFLAAISTHYFEEALLPIVVKIKHKVYGEQVFSSALSGCDIIARKHNDWVHPATLSLTVYDDVQRTLNKDQENFLEVLPNYRKSSLNNIECVADILIKQSETSFINGKKVRYFTYYNSKPIYKIDSPWVSGLAQSFTGQVMLAAYLSTGQEYYLEYAREITNFLNVEIDKGGPLLIHSENDYWYSEYANPNIEIPEVLNGHFLALDLLYWMNMYDENYIWEQLFINGLNSVVNSIDKYSSLTWSYYDKKGNFANGKYHRFHIRQLERYAPFDSSGKLLNNKNKMQLQVYLPFGIFERLMFQPSKLLALIVSFFMCLYIFIFYCFIFLNTMTLKNSNKGTGS